MSDHGEAYVNLFLFSVGGVHFAIDADQAAGMVPYAGEKAGDLCWLHEELDFGGRAIAYRSPVIVTIKTPDGQPYRVIIDSMEDISEFRRDEIRLFPELLEPFMLQKGIWGVLPRNGRLVLLVDFLRLLKEKSSKATGL